MKVIPTCSTDDSPNPQQIGHEHRTQTVFTDISTLRLMLQHTRTPLNSLKALPFRHLTD